MFHASHGSVGINPHLEFDVAMKVHLPGDRRIIRIIWWMGSRWVVPGCYVTARTRAQPPVARDCLYERDPASRCESPSGTLPLRKDKSRRSTTLSLVRGEWRSPNAVASFGFSPVTVFRVRPLLLAHVKVLVRLLGCILRDMIVSANDATSPNKVISRIIFWTPAVAYAGFLLAGSEQGPNKIGMMVTTGFMGALLGFLLGIMFTLRELRRSAR
jgi:hypothetical protein